MSSPEQNRWFLPTASIVIALIGMIMRFVTSVANWSISIYRKPSN